MMKANPMPEKTVAQKLLVKAPLILAIINAPEGYEAALAAPDGVAIQHDLSGAPTMVHLFVYNKADIEAYVPAVIAALKPAGVLWIAYPKKSGAVKTDISRDNGWDALAAADWHGVMQISLDATWSMLRFRPRAEIKIMTRKF
jgi:hypothetical protein